MAYTTATLTGTYLTGDGQPASGVIEIIPNYRALIDAEGDVILSGRIKVTLDETGSFSAVLPSTDDETVEPATGRQYTVSAKLRHQHLPAVTGIELAAGETVDMADVTSAAETVAQTSVWLTEEEYQATVDRVTALETSPATRWLVEDGGTYPARPEPADEPVVYVGETDPSALMLDGDVWINQAADTDAGLTAEDVGADPAGTAAAAVAELESGLSATYGGRATVYVGPPSGVTATDTAAIQAKIDALSALGGGVVQLAQAPKASPYLVTNIELPSNVIVRGAGEMATYVQVAASAGAGVHAFISDGFAGLTGTDAWLVSAGVPVGFGLADLTVDGNKAGRGLSGGTEAADIANAAVAFYGKNLVCDNLRIINSPGDGWYSETGDSHGQADETDLPEGHIGRLVIRACEGVGARVKGPHDARWGDLIALTCGREGLVVASDNATYEGTFDINFIHVYSCGQRYAALGRDNVPGVRLDVAGIRCPVFISEGNNGPSVIANGENLIVGAMFAYGNYASASAAATSHHIQLAGQDSQIGSIRCDVEFGGSAVLVTGPGVQIGQMMLRGTGSTGVGLDVDGSNVKVNNFLISGFSGTGAHGVRLNRTSGRAGTYLRGTTYDCANGLTAGINGGTGNMYIGLDLDVRIAADGTSAAQTAHNLDANFVATKPVTSSVVVVPRGSTTTPALAINTDPSPTTPKIDVYTTPGTTTWTKPSGAVWVEVFAFAGGGGGGSGRRGAAGSIRTGGGGGGGGQALRAVFSASDLGATEGVTVGAGGTGGAAVGSDSTVGVAGADGGSSYFGAAANRWVNTDGGKGGAGGLDSTAASGGFATFPGGTAGAASVAAGTAGATANGGTGRGWFGCAAAGGSGGGITAANATSNGGAGGLAPSTTTTTPPAGGAAPGGAGTPGIAPRSGARMPGGGGAGGASATAAVGGAGGAGAVPGGGGGGGGASQNGLASGAGGNGGAGMVIVVTHFR